MYLIVTNHSIFCNYLWFHAPNRKGFITPSPSSSRFRSATPLPRLSSIYRYRIYCSVASTYHLRQARSGTATGCTPTCCAASSRCYATVYWPCPYSPSSPSPSTDTSWSGIRAFIPGECSWVVRLLWLFYGHKCPVVLMLGSWQWNNHQSTNRHPTDHIMNWGQ